MKYEISSSGLVLIERFEGFRSEQYLDSGGVPTIGFGTTAAVVNPLPKTCTVEQATAWLKLYVDKSVIPAIEGLGVDLTQNEVDALCSLGYNCGAGIISGDTSIGNALRDKDFADASADFMLYDHDAATGEVLSGLESRRAAERALFDTHEEPPAHGVVYFNGTVDLKTDRWTINQTHSPAFYGHDDRVFAAETQLQVEEGGHHHWRIEGIAPDTTFAPETQSSIVKASGVAHYVGWVNLRTGKWAQHWYPGTAHYGTHSCDWAAEIRFEITNAGKDHHIQIDRVPRRALPLG